MNAKRTAIVIVLTTLCLMALSSVSGCGPGQMLGPSFTPTPTATPTRVPTATPTPTPQPVIVCGEGGPQFVQEAGESQARSESFSFWDDERGQVTQVTMNVSFADSGNQYEVIMQRWRQSDGLHYWARVTGGALGDEEFKCEFPN